MNAGRLIAAAALVLMLSGCGRVVLFDRLSESQANEVLAALLERNIDVTKSKADDKQSWMIEVDPAGAALAMRVLESRRLPRPVHETLGSIFEKKGFVSSPLEEKARYLHGLSEELARTLTQIDGVLSARVHIALPQKDMLSGTTAPSSASVVLMTEREVNLGDRETDLKAIVKDSIEGLDDVNKVTVKFFEVAPLNDAHSAQSTAPVAKAGMLTAAGAGGAAVAGALVAGGMTWRRRRTTTDVDSRS